MRRRGWKTSARAKATRAACPPESSSPRREARRSQPTARSCRRAAAFARERGHLRHRRGKATLAKTLMCPKILGSWLTTATRLAREGTNASGPSTTTSPKRTSPESRASRPAKSSAKVDLPAPLCPMTATTSPGSTSRPTSHPRASIRPETEIRADSASSAEKAPSPSSPASWTAGGGWAERSPYRSASSYRRARRAGHSVKATTHAEARTSTTPTARALSESLTRTR